ncbi:MAG: hypothetical protein IM569_13705 [Chitinophagaceae bacterium]|nr:hypothetical protein [Chitinophagaceae bacterium]
MTAQEIIKRASKYFSLSLALSSLTHCIQPAKWSIVLGDDNRFWVVTNREASILMKAGYELFQ